MLPPERPRPEEAPLNSYDHARARLVSSDLSQQELFEIAASRPDLHVEIARHPAAYPALLDWLGTVGEPAVQQAVAARADLATSPAAHGSGSAHQRPEPPSAPSWYESAPSYGRAPLRPGQPAGPPPGGTWPSTPTWQDQNVHQASPGVDPQDPARPGDPQATAPARTPRRTGLWVAVAVLAVALVVGIVFFLRDANADDSPETGDAPADSAPENPSDQPGSPGDMPLEFGEVVLEPGVIPVGSEGARSRNEGGAVVSVYLDFSCGLCADFNDLHVDTLRELTSGGDVTAEYHPIAILDTTDDHTGFSTRAAQAAAAVAHTSPDHFLDFVDAMFAAAGDDPSPDDETILVAAEAAGVPETTVERFWDAEYAEWVAEATELADAEGVYGTPTIRVDGQQLVDWTDPAAITDAVADAG